MIIDSTNAHTLPLIFKPTIILSAIVQLPHIITLLSSRSPQRPTMPCVVVMARYREVLDYALHILLVSRWLLF